MANRHRDLALFNLGLDCKLRACGLVMLRVRDIRHGLQLSPRAIVMQQKTHRLVQLLLGHSKLESTVRYLGIEVDDALEIAEQTAI